LMTGHDPTNFSPTGLAVAPSREDLPSVGAVVSRYRPAGRGGISYVAVRGPVREGAQAGAGHGGGAAGRAPGPLKSDAAAPRAVPLTGPADDTLGRLRARIDLRGSLAARSRVGSRDFDGYYGQAYSLISAPRTLRAFRLEAEPPALRERYGLTRFGQSCLLARR